VPFFGSFLRFSIVIIDLLPRLLFSKFAWCSPRAYNCAQRSPN
jgi:hypothetical protein